MLPKDEDGIYKLLRLFTKEVVFEIYCEEVPVYYVRQVSNDRVHAHELRDAADLLEHINKLAATKWYSGTPHKEIKYGQV